jgi:hypothetical protein
MYAHAFHRLGLKPDDETREVTIALRPSTPVPVRVVGPDGRPTPGVEAISRVILQPTWIAWHWWRPYYRGEVLPDGHFTVHGLAEDVEVPVYFLDDRHRWGATARLSGRSGAKGPVTVRLEPFGAARARLVDRSGRPVPRSRDGAASVTLVVTQGPRRDSQEKGDQERLAADEYVVSRFDRTHHLNGPVSDEEGGLTLPELIPGATYRLYDDTLVESSGPRLRREFAVKSGETLDLGDVRLEQPGP